MLLLNRPKGDKQKVWPMSYCRVENGQLEFGWLSDHWREELEVGFNKAEQKQVFEGNGTPPNTLISSILLPATTTGSSVTMELKT